MELQKDFAELCSLFNARGVEFLIVGGYAVAFHGAPRFTGDLDILIRPHIELVPHARSAPRVRHSSSPNCREGNAAIPAHPSIGPSAFSSSLDD
jgi:hypothetical protein